MRNLGVPLGSRARAGLLALSLAACGQVDVLGTIQPPSPTVEAPQAGAAAAAGARAEDPSDPPRASDAGPTRTGIPSCDGSAAVFARALCACETVSLLGDLRTRRVPDTGAPPGADVGINGQLYLAAFAGVVAGDLTIAGATQNALGGAGGRIEGTLRLQGDLILTGTASVAADAWLRGQLLGDGVLIVENDAHRSEATAAVPPALATATMDVGGQLVTEEFAIAPPCACGEDAFDIAAIVAGAAVDNDNAENGFAPESLTGAPAGAVHELPEGRSFAHELSGAGDVTLRVTGASALFIGGDVRVGGALRAELEEGAELELWVARDLAVAGPIALGSPAQAAAARMYVGSAAHADAERPPPGRELAEQIPVPPPAADAVATPDDAWTVNLYAPRLDLALPRDTVLAGSLFVRSIVGADLQIDHDPRVAGRRSLCE